MGLEVRPYSELILTRKLTFVASIRCRAADCAAKQTFERGLCEWTEWSLSHPQQRRRACWFDDLHHSLQSFNTTSDIIAYVRLRQATFDPHPSSLADLVLEDGSTPPSPKLWIAYIRQLIDQVLNGMSDTYRLQCKRTSTNRSHPPPDCPTYGLLHTAHLPSSERNFTTLAWRGTSLEPMFGKQPLWLRFIRSIPSARAIWKFRACRPDWMLANAYALRGTPRHQRVCSLCNGLFDLRHIDDEYHVIMNCPIAVHERHTLLMHANLADRPQADLPDCPLTRTLYTLTNPQTPEHAIALASLIMRSHATRELFKYIIDQHQSLPNPTHSDLRPSITAFRKSPDHRLLARNLPPTHAILSLLMRLHTSTWHDLQNPQLQLHTQSYSLCQTIDWTT